MQQLVTWLLYSFVLQLIMIRDTESAQESTISKNLMMPSKETLKERHERLSKRVAKIRREAGERLTKDAVIQCRVEPAQMGRLQSIARAKGLSISALTRMWLLERLQQEKLA
jgi:hypothetical protein